MLNAQEKVIGDVTYTISPFTGAEAIRLPSVLAKYFGPILTRTFMGAMLAGSVLDADVSGLISALPGFFETLDETTYWALIKRLLHEVMAVCPDSDGSKIVVHFNDNNENDNFTKVFQGRTMDVFKVIAAILQVNYPDFFAIAQKNLGKLLKKTDSSMPQKTDTKENSINSEK